MIDWKMTHELLGDVGPLRFNPHVYKICEGCSKRDKVRYKGFNKPTAPYYCKACVANRPEKRAKSSAGAKEAWQSSEYRQAIIANSEQIWADPDRNKRMSAFRNSPNFKERMAEINRNKVTPEFKEKMSIIATARWQDPDYYRTMVEQIKRISKESWDRPEYREKISKIMRGRWMDEQFRLGITQGMLEHWQDPDYRAKMMVITGSEEFRKTTSEAAKKTWADPEYYARMMPIIAKCRANSPKVSSLQATFYSILDDLGVKYFRERNDAPDDPECSIGPYSVDCIIPRSGKPDLIVEVQGEYWHSLPENIARDKAKASYINDNFPGRYELKYVWEHEFNNKDKVIELVKYWLGIFKLELIKFSLDDLVIREGLNNDIKLLFNKYHYLGSFGRNGVAYGAYLGDALVASCVFSSLRHVGAEYNGRGVRELSRLCIHPRYQMRNLASWFVSRCLKLLPDKIKLVVSYCDTTFNHDGATYKACNFALDKTLDPDYWYVSQDGWVMHQSAMYRRAKRAGLAEAAYAEGLGYVKVWGKKKFRFIYER